MNRKIALIVLCIGIILMFGSFFLLPGAAYEAAMAGNISLLLLPYLGYAPSFVGLILLIASVKRIPRYLVVLLAIPAWFAVFFITGLSYSLLAPIILK